MNETTAQALVYVTDKALAHKARAEALEAEVARLTAERNALRAVLEEVAEGHPKDYTDNYLLARNVLDKFRPRNETAV